MHINPISLGAGVPVDVTKLHKRYRIDLGAVDIYLEPDTLDELAYRIDMARRHGEIALYLTTETLHEVSAAMKAAEQVAVLVRSGFKESEL